MSTVIVKTDNRKNYTAGFPFVGDITIDENGEFEVKDEETARKLIAYSSEFYLKSEGKPVVEASVVDTLQEKKLPPAMDLSDELTPEEKQDQADALEALLNKDGEGTGTDELQKTETDELGDKGNQTDEIGGGDDEDNINSQTGGDEGTGSEGSDDDAGELSAEEKATLIGALPNMTRKELEDACKVYPGGEWRGKNKDLLIEYLTGKLS